MSVWNKLGLILATSVMTFLAYALAHLVHNRGVDVEYPIAFNFDNISLKSWQQYGLIESCCGDSLSVMPLENEAANNRVLEVQLSRNDPDVHGSKRAELRLRAAKFNQPFWYKFRVFIPQDWENDEVPTTIVQWHGVPDKLLLEAGRAPPLYLNIQNGEMGIGNFYDRKRVTRFLKGQEKPQGFNLLWRAPVEKGKWLSFSFFINWSIEDDGVINIYKDGAQIVSYLGPNTYNDTLAPYFKVGLYAPHWKVGKGRPSINHRRIMFDDIFVDRGNQKELAQAYQPNSRGQF